MVDNERSRSYHPVLEVEVDAIVHVLSGSIRMRYGKLLAGALKGESWDRKLGSWEAGELGSWGAGELRWVLR